MTEKRVVTKRQRLYEIIFESNSRAGHYFDIGLIAAICISVVVTMLNSVAAIRQEWGTLLSVTEWILTALFTLEYILRIVALTNPRRYITSNFGIVDLMSFLPSYLELFVPGPKYLTIFRVLRLIRIFRIFKLIPYMKQLTLLRTALYQSRRKITVFCAMVLGLVIILGSIMYIIEGPENGFTSIPKSIYWAIVTLTTVGYGDISPQTTIGQFISSSVMLLGYAIIAVSGAIVSVEMSKEIDVIDSGKLCPSCGLDQHDFDATFCKNCGCRLD